MSTLFSLPSLGWGSWSLLVVVGVMCGFINTFAGGGSLITLPLLIFLWIPPHQANASNRLALVFQNAASVSGFWWGGVRDTKSIVRLAGPALVGSFLGAYLAVVISPELFKKALGVFMLIALVPLMRPHKASQQEAPEHPSVWLMILFFGVGIYAGFIQAGAGIWSLLALLLVGGYDLNRANAVKSQLLFLSTLLATAVFLWKGQVIFVVGLVLAVGNSLGAWLATTLASKVDMRMIRWLLLLVILFSSARLFGLL